MTPRSASSRSGSPRSAGFWIIVVSLVFAALMLVASALIKDPGLSQTVVFLLIAAWWIPFSFLRAPEGVRRELSCIRRRVAGLLGRSA